MRIELAIKQDFWDFLSVVGGIFYGKIKKQTIYAISTDSRECQDGDIFFALSGQTYNGNNFIEDAINKGAIPIGTDVKKYGIKVYSANAALLAFSSFYKQQLRNLKYTVAITGSVGKTTTKEMLKKIANIKYKTHSTSENFNNDIGVSYTILSAPMDTEILICEIGMNNFGEIRSLSSALMPDIGIITRIGSAHIGNLGSIENIAKAKLEITESLRNDLIIPYNEPLLYASYPRITYFSALSHSADILITKNTFDQCELYICGYLEKIFHFSHCEEHLLHCLAAATAAAIKIGISVNDIYTGIATIDNTSFRHRLFASSKGFLILDDSYNASYESVCVAVLMLNNASGARKKHILLGDILELGTLSEDIHYKIGEILAHNNIECLFLFGDQVKYVAKGAIDNGFDKKRIFMNNDVSSPEITSNQIIQTISTNDIILAKASHKINLKQVINLIE